MERDKRAFATTVAIAALTLAACGGPDDAIVENSEPAPADQGEVDQPPVTRLEPEPEPEPEPELDDSGNDEPIDAAGDGTSLADAAPLVGEPIEWADDDTAWRLDLYGLADVPSDDPNGGTCVALAGTATPTAIKNEQPWTASFARPLIELQAGGQPVEQTNDRGGCDTTAFANAGYLPFEEMFVSRGSPYNFVVTFQLESGDIGDVEAVVLASTDDREPILSYYLPTIADGIVPPVPPSSDYSAFTVLPADVGSISIDAAFDLDSMDDHDVQIQGLATAAADDMGAASRGPGSCRVIVGSMTVTDTQGEFASGVGPKIYLLIGGHRLIPRNSMCDTREIESAGYQNIEATRFLTGTSVDFFEAVFVPQSLTDAEVLVAIDGHTGRDTRLMTPPILDTLPAPLAAPDTYTVPPTLGPLTAAPISVPGRSGITEYTMSPIGFFIGDLNQDGTRRCVHFLATVAAEGPPDWIYSLNVLSSGQVHNSRNDGCDDALVESAGYRQSTEADFVGGADVALYATFALPPDEADTIEALVLGNVADPDVWLFDPVLIDAIPTV